MIPRIFDGQSCAICAGGPSLTGFDWNRLRGKNIIAINRAYEVLPFAQVLWWSDARFWRRNKVGLLAHAAPWKATACLDYRPNENPEDALDPSVHEYHFSGLRGFDPRPAYLRHGNCSAHAAIHLAAHLGARRIVIFGLDMKQADGGAAHWHDGHGALPTTTAQMADLMLPHFAPLALALADRDIEVVNASPDSALTVWPRCSIDDGLAML